MSLLGSAGSPAGPAPRPAEGTPDSPPRPPGRRRVSQVNKEYRPQVCYPGYRDLAAGRVNDSTGTREKGLPEGLEGCKGNVNCICPKMVYCIRYIDLTMHSI